MDTKQKQQAEMDPETMTISMLLGQIGRIRYRQKKEDVSRSGLQPGFRKIHAELIRNDGCAQRFLADQTGLSAPTVSIALGKMESEGLVRREVDSIDTRRSKVFLTEKGWEIDAAMRELARENDAYLVEPLSETEQSELRQLLWKILKHLEESNKIET